MRSHVSHFLVVFTLCLTSLFVYAQEGTRVVVLGTGTPVPDYKRAGAGIAIIHKGQAYLFDAGKGVVQRAIEANQRLGLAELEPININYLFLTHLHSDHIHDYSTLASSRWWSRENKLKVWGPVGLSSLTGYMNKMLEVEAAIRTRGTPKEIFKHMDGYQAIATEIHDGIVFKRDDLTIEAFTVPHGNVKPAFGYKITTADKSIVISGDTTYSEEIIRQAKGVDLLFHEVISKKALLKFPEIWQRYHNSTHTTTDELAKLATQARPKKLVLYHILFMDTSEQALLEEVRSGYDGEVILPDDLEVF